jgi:hypothetical protein
LPTLPILIISTQQVKVDVLLGIGKRALKINQQSRDAIASTIFEGVSVIDKGITSFRASLVVLGEET